MCDIDISVIMPTYNTEAYLDQAISSARANDRCTLEILCVNDGSTDGSLEIMRRHEAEDPRVRIIDKENQGYGASMNRGIDEARGRYIAILEPDDYVLPHMYDKLTEVASAHLWPDMVKTPYWRVWMPGTDKEHLYLCSYAHRIKPEGQRITLKDCPRIIQHHPSIWSAIYRRDFLIEKEIRFMEVPGAGWVDNPFLIDTCVQAESIVYYDEAYYCYREDLPGSSSAMRNLELPFERWHNMADELERLGVTDDGILQAFYVIGFRYAGALIEAVGLEDQKYVDLIAQMFRRMDPERVTRIENLSGGFKKTYFRLASVEPIPFDDKPYLKALADEFVYSVKLNGWSFALSRLAIYGRRFGVERGIMARPTATKSASI